MSNETETQYLHGNVIRCPNCGTVTLASVHGGLCTDCYANTRKRSERERKFSKKGHRMNRGVRNKSERGLPMREDR